MKKITITNAYTWNNKGDAGIASTPTTGKPSYKLGNKNTSNAWYNSFTSFLWPKNLTDSVKLRSFTLFFISSISGPCPAKLRPFSKRYATDYICCSELAGRWLFGDKVYDNGEVYLLNNAIH